MERVRKEQKSIQQDEQDRAEVEEGVNELKRRYSLNEIRKHLVLTLITLICLSVIARNLGNAYWVFLYFRGSFKKVFYSGSKGKRKKFNTGK